MKKNKKLIVGLVALALLLTIGVSSAYASWGNGDRTCPNFDPEKREAIMEAIENNDYQTWSDLTVDSSIAEYINEDNFSKFVEMHNLLQQAKEIAEELGLPEHGGKMFKRGYPGHWGNSQEQ